MASNYFAYEYLESSEAAELLRCSKRTLARWRAEGIGPRYCKRGGRILYPLALLREWVAQITKTPPRSEL